MRVIITGSSKGIGRSIAFRFAEAGYDVTLCARDENMLKKVSAEMKAAYPSVQVDFKAADLSAKAEVLKFADWCLSIGTPDILVNNAGSYLPGNCYDEADGNMETMMAINFYSAYHLTRALLPAMRSAGKGHIFNMCSIASLHAYKGGGSYSVSKFALNGFNHNLRLELMKDRIKVTAVYPGAVFTDSWEGFDNSNSRIMESGDIAEMILAASRLTIQANVDEIIIRPVEGDLN